MMFNAAGELRVRRGRLPYRGLRHAQGTVPIFVSAKMGLSLNAATAARKRILCSEIDGQHFNEPTTWRSIFAAGSISPIPIISIAASRP